MTEKFIKEEIAISFCDACDRNNKSYVEALISWRETQKALGVDEVFMNDAYELWIKSLKHYGKLC